MGTGAEQVHVESSSDDELVFLQPQALPVAEGVPSFEGPPATAEEYLARVRYEASQCPAVVRVEYDFKALAETQRLQPPTVPRYNEIPTAPPGMQPKPRWVQSFTASFSELRDLLHEAVVAKQTPLRPMNTPSLGDVDAWELYAMGSEDADTGLEGFGGCRGGGHQPCTSCLIAMDQVTATALLERLSDRFVQSPEFPGHLLAVWIFSLAARVERPLTADTEASLRAMLRHASALRARAGDPHHPAVPLLNLLVALAGGYFGQDESLGVLMDV